MMLNHKVYVRFKGPHLLTLLASIFLFLAISGCLPWYQKYNFESRDEITEIDAVPGLINALQDPDWYTRKEAAWALGEIGPEAEEAIPALIVAARDKNFEVRHEAAVAMSKIGSDTNESVPVLILINKLESPSWSEVADAAAELGEMGKKAVPAVSALADVVDNKHDIWNKKYNKARIQAVRTLGKIGPEAAAAIPSLINNMRDVDRDVRLEIVLALQKMGTAVKSAITELVYTLEKDKVATVRKEAAVALGNLGANAKFATTPLITAFAEDPNPFVCEAAAEALIKIDPSSPEVVDAFSKGLSDDDPRIRTIAVKMLVALGNKAQSAVPALTEALEKDVDLIRVYAATALGNIGPAAGSAIPALTKALDSENVKLRQEAAKALASIGTGDVTGPPGTIARVQQALLRLTKDFNPDVKINAVNALTKYRPIAPETLAVLKEMLKTERNEKVKNTVARALIILEAMWKP